MEQDNTLLNEEFLLKIGFTKNEDNFSLILEGYDILINPVYETIVIVDHDSNGFVIFKKQKFFRHFKSLFYSLTNKNFFYKD